MEFLGMDFSCAFGSLSNGKFPDKDCLLALLSKFLGYFIVAISTTVKLPQILKILKHKSVAGLSVVSFELDVVGYTIALSYCVHKGLPFSAYGELAFLLIQAIILVAIIYYFSQPVGTKTWIRALLYCAIAPTILAGQIDPIVFEALYVSQHAIFFFARVPQIWKNYTQTPKLMVDQISKPHSQSIVAPPHPVMEEWLIAGSNASGIGHERRLCRSRFVVWELSPVAVAVALALRLGYLSFRESDFIKENQGNG
ncbi:hypothetical protein F0562_035853 [Nyssa sinensis]|uniref:Mannose-P-dolichol utilization defect 1 protein homolog n=1 Tax=Nyssa sinensis TaxID=561372 RepID=A0A5J5AE81_9ASTE|nr:hypothetical protein F0562_035853 [Nyssa sinensis]